MSKSIYNSAFYNFNSGPRGATGLNGLNGLNGATGATGATGPIGTYIYYNVVDTTSTTVNPAIANTHYTLEFGGTITISPLNVGQHLMVTALDNGITINFTGTSFVTNSYLAGSTSNPSFSLLNATLELMCVQNLGQTYYNIIRVAQTHIGSSLTSTCTLNGVKISALNDINDIPNVNITSVSNGQVLAYDTTSSKWLNHNIYGNFTTISNLTGPITVTGIAGTMYIGGNITLNMPSGAVGDIIQIAGNGGANTIVFPTGTFLIHGASGYQNFTMASNFGVATLICVSVNSWALIGLTDLWANTAITKNFSGSVIKVADLFDSNITSLSNGDVLTYNSGTAKWINSASGGGAVSSIFGRTGSVVATEGDYSLTLLSDVTLTTPSTGQTMRYDGSGWLNFTRYSNIYFNSGQVLTANYYIGPCNTSNTKENCKVIVSSACTIINMSVKLSANPNSTNTRTFTMLVNGTSVPAFAVTLTGAATTGMVTNSYSLAQYDDITFFHTLTGSPLGAQAYITLDILV